MRYISLLLRRRERVINRAEREPSRLNDLGLVSSAAVLRSLGKDNSETSLKMPVNMADGINQYLDRDRKYTVNLPMQEPSAGVVSLESDDHTGASDTDDIAARGINEVKSSAITGLDDIECMSVKMERVGDAVQSTLDVEFDDLVASDDKSMLRWLEVISGSSTESDDLKESGNNRRDVLDTIDEPLKCSILIKLF